MPDVSRSDSQRSDASRPRVSFNRDVHVKRIGTAGAPRVVGALAGDGAGRLLPLAVRRERPTRLSRRDLAKEAQRVLEQADKVTCTGQSSGLLPVVAVDKYSTLPPIRRKKHRVLKHNHSLREKNPRVVGDLTREGNSSSSTERGSIKRPRTAPLGRSASDVGKKEKKEPIRAADTENKTKFWSLDRLRSKRNKPVASRSDVDKSQISSILSKKSHSDSEKAPRRFNSDSETASLSNGKKKQLSPIIEVSPRDDYFVKASEVEEEVDALINNKAPQSTKTSKVIAVTNNALVGKNSTSKKLTREVKGDKSPKVPNRARKAVKSASRNNETSVRNKDSNNSALKITNNLPTEPKMESILHSSQTISKPTLTRGLTVDTMVRKLSQDRAGRGPPRVVNPLALVSPGDDRQHNNNLPFSYTEPPLYGHEDKYTSLLSDKESHAINGFLKGASERDNNAVPTLSRKGDSPTMNPTSDSVNGTEPTQVIYAEVICNGGGTAGGLTKQTVHTSVPLGKVKETEDMGSERHHTEYKTHLGDYSKANNGVYRKEFVTETRDYIVEGRGRADGMDSRRNQLEDDSYRRVSPIRRNLMEDFINNEGNRGYGYDSRKYSDDRIEPVLQKPRVHGNLDLSSRRDRLESRIESQRKDRLLSSRINDSLNRSHQDINDMRIIDNHRKYPSNPRLDSDYNRREFLNSQLNSDNLKDTRLDSDRYYGDTSLHRSIDNIDKYNKKDQFTDSGIDINYHGQELQSNKVISEVRSYHNTYETTTNTDVNVRVPKPKSTSTSTRPTLTNVTKVDVNGHIKPDASDEEEDVDTSPKYYYNQQENIDRMKKRSGLQSTKLVQESKRSADVLPPSAVLIRHYAPTDHQNGYHEEDASRGRREFDERREWSEERNSLKRKCDLGDIEETRRFLVEERRRSVEERLDDDCERRPEKVVQKKAKIDAKASGKKKQGTMDKMKALFSRSDAKKKSVKKEKDKKETPAVDPLTSRYVEYKGSTVELDRATPVQTTLRPPGRSGYKTSSNQLHVEEANRSRRERLATPSPSPSRPATATLNRVNNSRNTAPDNSAGGWFKSLDRLRGKNKPKPKIEQHDVISENENEDVKTYKHQNNNNVDKTNKNLRFFGDTDAESVRSHSTSNHHKVIRPMTSLPENPTPTRYTENISQQSSTRYVPLRDSNNRRYKSGNNKLQVPRRRHHRSAGELATSSAESTTEGDSSQQSQRSVVYLHAATVGDIPGRVPSRTGRRARSREELSSTTGSTIQPQTRTVSRSISVLAPWKPRHYREGLEVHYENDSNGPTSRGGKPPKIPPNSSSKSTSTLNRLKNKNDSQKSYNSLSREGHKDKENLSRKSLNSLNREGRRDKENYNKSESTDSLNREGVKGSRRVLNSAQSIESLGQMGKGKSRVPNGLNASSAELNGNKGYRSGTTLKKGKTETSKKRTELSRSVSMPKDSKVKSGWFRRKK